MKKSLKKLQINKEVVTKLDVDQVIGGHCGPTDLMCNSTPEWEGGIGCQEW
ncbi:class I lanthipeptide [Kordia sp.]|uniref:class I lanthipeptide n=1 Tax=Kordia sp. TaxID=1965332 RepID=UPI003B59C9AD